MVGVRVRKLGGLAGSAACIAPFKIPIAPALKLADFRKCRRLVFIIGCEVKEGEFSNQLFWLQRLVMESLTNPCASWNRKYGKNRWNIQCVRPQGTKCCQPEGTRPFPTGLPEK